MYVVVSKMWKGRSGGRSEERSPVFFFSLFYCVVFTIVGLDQKSC